jgi:hypothetical protein
MAGRMRARYGGGGCYLHPMRWRVRLAEPAKVERTAIQGERVSLKRGMVN